MPYLPRGPFLDLFGGTGALVIEALSRGAPEATVVELDRRTAKLINTNISDLGVEEPVELLVGDACDWLPRLAEQGRQYAIISVTPPYYEDLEERMLDLLDQHPTILQPDGVMYVQYPTQQEMDLERKAFELWKTKKYGNTILSYFWLDEDKISRGTA
jgi:16S rRNA (guanine966-N2)-methyltransferase